MNSVSAQEIKRRGIGAVDTVLEEGPVYVIKHNRARYVVMSEEDYRQLTNQPLAMRVEEATPAPDAEVGQRGAGAMVQSEETTTYTADPSSSVRDLTLRNIPAALYERLEHSAHLHRRNPHDEALACLEKTLMSAPFDPGEFLARLDRLHQKLDVTPLSDEMLDRAKNEGRP